MATLKELRDIRLNKLNTLKKMGVNPYPADSQKDAVNNDIVTNFKNYENKTLSLTGYIKSIREHGKLVFLDLKDQSGSIQVYIREDTLEQTDAKKQNIGFEHLGLLDIGDYIQVIGTITKTQSGEMSILAQSIKMLSKTLRPIPEELKDRETKMRRRYVDVKVNNDVFERFERRAKFWRETRNFLNSKGFLEMNIPVLEPIPGGADANPFITHMDAIDEDFYLRISQELYLKRLLGAGYEKVYEIGPRFRNEGLSDEHLPEHIAMEFYWAYADWKDGMKFIQSLYTHILDTVYEGKRVFSIRGFEVDFSNEWELLDFETVLKDKYGINVHDASVDEVTKLLKENDIKVTSDINISRGVDLLWKNIRKTIAGPAFLINHPKYLSPLSKSHADNSNIVQRIQPIIAGTELGNGWSELNDPQDQLDRFLKQQKLRDAGDDEAQWLDIDYVEMLEYGMPPAFGWGHAERVFWFLEDVTAREGVPFPQLKYEVDSVTKEIYPDIDFSTIRDTKNTNTQKVSKYKNVMSDDINTKDLMSIEDALTLLNEHVKDDYQLLHSKMVATVLKEYAKKYGEDENLWYITGLLHDLDYFESPKEHPNKAIEWFKELELPQSLIYAIQAHAFDRTGIHPKNRLDAALIAVDELSGLLYAYSLMRENGFSDMNASGVKKKFKDKAFASKINRDDIFYGIEKLGVDFSDHVTFMINIFQNMDELKS